MPVSRKVHNLLDRMEFLLKIVLLGLSSATINSRFVAPYKLKAPLGIGLEIGETKNNLLNNLNILSNGKISATKQCFCIPHNAYSQPVTSLLDTGDQDVQRLVIYLYKTIGGLKIYVPSKNKQKLIPDLNFDKIEGDVLKPVTSESIVDVLDLEIINPQETAVLDSQDIKEEVETLDVEEQVNVNIEQPIINTANDLVEQQIINPDNEIVDEITIIPANEIQEQTIINPANEIIEQSIINSANDIVEQSIINPANGIVEQSIQENVFEVESEINTLVDNTLDSVVEEIISDENSNDIQTEIVNNVDQQSQNNLAWHDSQETNNQNTIANNVNVVNTVEEELDVIPNADNSDQLQQIESLVNLKPSNNQNIENEEIINTNEYDQIIQNDLPHEHSTDSWNSPYMSFYDWFEIQLKRIIVYNLETQSKIIELRKRIEKILEASGMNISIKGIVTDSNGKLVYMNNLKLRPILIGSQIDVQSLLDETNQDTGVSYIQLIEIIQIAPPKLLGTLVVGTVYLPRKLLGGIHVNKVTTQGQKSNGCVWCKPKNIKIQNSYTQPSSPVNLYPNDDVQYSGYEAYYAIPFRRKNTKNGFSYNGQKNVKVEPERQQNVSVKGRDGIIEDVLGSLSPILINSQSRRLLGGRLPNGPKSGPRSYPNDVLPGFRIIGGNAATSSGTPLVNKGRSGFEDPSNII